MEILHTVFRFDTSTIVSHAGIVNLMSIKEYVRCFYGYVSIEDPEKTSS